MQATGRTQPIPPKSGKAPFRGNSHFDGCDGVFVPRLQAVVQAAGTSLAVLTEAGPGSGRLRRLAQSAAALRFRQTGIFMSAEPGRAALPYAYHFQIASGR